MTMNHEKCQSLYSVIPKIIISLSLAGHTYWIRSWQVLSFSAPGPIWCATHLSHSAAREAMGNHEPERRRDDGMICWGHLSFKVWPKIFSWIETWKWANAWFQILIYIYWSEKCCTPKLWILKPQLFTLPISPGTTQTHSPRSRALGSFRHLRFQR